MLIRILVRFEDLLKLWYIRKLQVLRIRLFRVLLRQRNAGIQVHFLALFMLFLFVFKCFLHNLRFSLGKLLFFLFGLVIVFLFFLLGQVVPFELAGFEDLASFERLAILVEIVTFVVFILFCKDLIGVWWSLCTDTLIQ
jgi:hypothetical protein